MKLSIIILSIVFLIIHIRSLKDIIINKDKKEMFEQMLQSFNNNNSISLKRFHLIISIIDYSISINYMFFIYNFIINYVNNIMFIIFSILLCIQITNRIYDTYIKQKMIINNNIKFYCKFDSYFYICNIIFDILTLIILI